MFTNRKLPSDFIKLLDSLEKSYLDEGDPIRQSGFGGGARRWEKERKPILEAIHADGDLLDIGCANGYLLECLIEWGRAKGLSLTPYGLDYSQKLIELAKERLPQFKDNFYSANAWEWRPDRKFKYAYTLYDCVPLDFLEEYIHRLLAFVVSPGGRLIIGAYGSRTQNKPPFDIKQFLESNNFPIAGSTVDGKPVVTSFVWIDKDTDIYSNIS